MKTQKIVFAAVLAVAFSTSVFAQTAEKSKVATTKKEVVGTKTEMIKVAGNCETCKARIEKAAKVEGVSKADWSVKTKVLTLVYNPAKVKSDDIQKILATVGHDTPKYKADAKVYNALPGCCKYR